MAIDRTFQSSGRVAAAAVLVALAAACTAVPKPQPRPAPVPTPLPAPTPRPVPRPAPTDWRDSAQSPGDWHWKVSSGNSQASFGLPGLPVAMLTCDLSTRSVILARAGTSGAAVPVTIRSTFAVRTLPSDPAASKPGWVAVRLAARDPLLDQIAFSRGRFTIEVAGLAPLYLPSWPEISRVIEDCR